MVFLLLTALSPITWVIVKNPQTLKLNQWQWFGPLAAARLQEINTQRGQMTAAGWRSVGKILVNKYTWTAREMATRVAETFDPEYLFFTGDLDINRSTRTSGPVFLFTLPAVVWGWVKWRRKKLLAGLILASLLPSAVIEPHWFTPAKLMFFAIWNYVAAWGIINREKKAGWITAGWSLWVMYETANFAHDYLLHYPWRT